MFTVKAVDPDGNEFAIEAESYEVQWDREQDLVRVMTYDAKQRDGNYTGLWAGVPARGLVPSFKVYVMNRYGATVSTVYYSEIPPGHFGGANDGVPPADPEMLAA